MHPTWQNQRFLAFFKPRDAFIKLCVEQVVNNLPILLYMLANMLLLECSIVFPKNCNEERTHDLVGTRVLFPECSMCLIAPQGQMEPN